MKQHPTVRAPQRLFSDDAADARWRARFGAPRGSFPHWARDAPQRSLLLSNMSGVVEAYAYNRASGELRRVTDQRNGTSYAGLSPSGEEVWWFADDDGDEVGAWMVQPFEGGAADARPALDGVPVGYLGGIAVGGDVVAVGVGTEDGFEAWLARGTEHPELVYRNDDDGCVAALSRDDGLLAIEHSEDGQVALSVLSAVDGSTVATRSDGSAQGLEALAFAPVAGDARLLLRRERDDGDELVIWDVAAQRDVDLDVALPGELTASWYPDASALLLINSRHARSTLHRLDVRSGELRTLDTPRGTIDAASVRDDGTVEYLWSSAVHPPIVREQHAGGDRPLFGLPGGQPPPAAPLTDAWVSGTAGAIHALIAEPVGADDQRPLPTVFLLHGGPHAADEDRFSATRAVWTDAGCALVHVNYRGSTGYGLDWRDAIAAAPGLTELEDVAAVHDWAVASGLADPARCVIAGASWGGYLALLALGTQPDRWAAGIAQEPVADYAASYDDKMESMQEFDRALFGGSPAEVSERYGRSSPITYVERVRAPVLLLAGINDRRCPIRQITNYLDRLSEVGASYETYLFDAGHSSLVVDEIVRQVAIQVAFARRVLAL